MKIRLRQSLAGVNFNIPAGQIIDVEYDEGMRMIAAGIATAAGYETAEEKAKIENRGVQGNNTSGDRGTKQKRSKKLSKG
jgi:hypothetical protein